MWLKKLVLSFLLPPLLPFDSPCPHVSWFVLYIYIYMSLIKIFKVKQEKDYLYIIVSKPASSKEDKQTAITQLPCVVQEVELSTLIFWLQITTVVIVKSLLCILWTHKIS